MSKSSKGSDQRKVSTELFSLTYGALVTQLIKDYEEDAEINKQLEKMGYNIGIRLIEDFLARTGTGRCTDLRVTAETIAKKGFQMFLNITPTVTNWSPSGDAFSLILDPNPLTDFVELPEDRQGLNYSNILCGVIRGALEMANSIRYFIMKLGNEQHLKREQLLMNEHLVLEIAMNYVQLEVQAYFVSDQLRSADSQTELRIKFIRKLEDALPAGDD